MFSSYKDDPSCFNSQPLFEGRGQPPFIPGSSSKQTSGPPWDYSQQSFNAVPFYSGDQNLNHRHPSMHNANSVPHAENSSVLCSYNKNVISGSNSHQSVVRPRAVINCQANCETCYSHSFTRFPHSWGTASSESVRYSGGSNIPSLPTDDIPRYAPNFPQTDDCSNRYGFPSSLNKLSRFSKDVQGVTATIPKKNISPVTDDTVIMQQHQSRGMGISEQYIPVLATDVVTKKEACHIACRGLCGQASCKMYKHASMKCTNLDSLPVQQYGMPRENVVRYTGHVTGLSGGSQWHADNQTSRLWLPKGHPPGIWLPPHENVNSFEHSNMSNFWGERSSCDINNQSFHSQNYEMTSNYKSANQIKMVQSNSFKEGVGIVHEERSEKIIHELTPLHQNTGDISKYSEDFMKRKQIENFTTPENATRYIEAAQRRNTQKCENTGTFLCQDMQYQKSIICNTPSSLKPYSETESNKERCRDPPASTDLLLQDTTRSMLNSNDNIQNFSNPLDSQNDISRKYSFSASVSNYATYQNHDGKFHSPVLGIAQPPSRFGTHVAYTHSKISRTTNSIFPDPYVEDSRPGSCQLLSDNEGFQNQHKSFVSNKEYVGNVIHCPVQNSDTIIKCGTLKDMVDPVAPSQMPLSLQSCNKMTSENITNYFGTSTNMHGVENNSKSGYINSAPYNRDTVVINSFQDSSQDALYQSTSNALVSNAFINELHDSGKHYTNVPVISRSDREICHISSAYGAGYSESSSLALEGSPDRPIKKRKSRVKNVDNAEKQMENGRNNHVLDVRQFLETWDEEMDLSPAPRLPDVVLSNNSVENPLLVLDCRQLGTNGVATLSAVDRSTGNLIQTYQQPELSPEDNDNDTAKQPEGSEQPFDDCANLLPINPLEEISKLCDTNENSDIKMPKHGTPDSGIAPQDMQLSNPTTEYSLNGEENGTDTCSVSDGVIQELLLPSEKLKNSKSGGKDDISNFAPLQDCDLGIENSHSSNCHSPHSVQNESANTGGESNKYNQISDLQKISYPSSCNKEAMSNSNVFQVHCMSKIQNSNIEKENVKKTAVKTLKALCKNVLLQFDNSNLSKCHEHESVNISENNALKYKYSLPLLDSKLLVESDSLSELGEKPMVMAAKQNTDNTASKQEVELPCLLDNMLNDKEIINVDSTATYSASIIPNNEIVLNKTKSLRYCGAKKQITHLSDAKAETSAKSVEDKNGEALNDKVKQKTIDSGERLCESHSQVDVANTKINCGIITSSSNKSHKKNSSQTLDTEEENALLLSEDGDLKNILTEDAAKFESEFGTTVKDTTSNELKVGIDDGEVKEVIPAAFSAIKEGGKLSKSMDYKSDSYRSILANATKNNISSALASSDNEGDDRYDLDMSVTSSIQSDLEAEQSHAVKTHSVEIIYGESNEFFDTDVMEIDELMHSDTTETSEEMINHTSLQLEVPCCKMDMTDEHKGNEMALAHEKKYFSGTCTSLIQPELGLTNFADQTPELILPDAMSSIKLVTESNIKELQSKNERITKVQEPILKSIEENLNLEENAIFDVLKQKMFKLNGVNAAEKDKIPSFTQNHESVKGLQLHENQSLNGKSEIVSKYEHSDESIKRDELLLKSDKGMVKSLGHVHVEVEGIEVSSETTTESDLPASKLKPKAIDNAEKLYPTNKTLTPNKYSHEIKNCSNIVASCDSHLAIENSIELEYTDELQKRLECKQNTVKCSVSDELHDVLLRNDSEREEEKEVTSHLKETSIHKEENIDSTNNSAENILETIDSELGNEKINAETISPDVLNDMQPFRNKHIDSNCTSVSDSCKNLPIKKHANKPEKQQNLCNINEVVDEIAMEKKHQALDSVHSNSSPQINPEGDNQLQINVQKCKTISKMNYISKKDDKFSANVDNKKNTESRVIAVDIINSILHKISECIFVNENHETESIEKDEEKEEKTKSAERGITESEVITRKLEDIKASAKMIEKLEHAPLTFSEFGVTAANVILHRISRNNTLLNKDSMSKMDEDNKMLKEAGNISSKCRRTLQRRFSEPLIRNCYSYMENNVKLKTFVSLSELNHLQFTNNFVTNIPEKNELPIVVKCTYKCNTESRNTKSTILEIHKNDLYLEEKTTAEKEKHTLDALQHHTLNKPISITNKERIDILKDNFADNDISYLDPAGKIPSLKNKKAQKRKISHCVSDDENIYTLSECKKEKRISTKAETKRKENYSGRNKINRNKSKAVVKEVMDENHFIKTVKHSGQLLLTEITELHDTANSAILMGKKNDKLLAVQTSSNMNYNRGHIVEGLSSNLSTSKSKSEMTVEEGQVRFKENSYFQNINREENCEPSSSVLDSLIVTDINEKFAEKKCLSKNNDQCRNFVFCPSDTRNVPSSIEPCRNLSPSYLQPTEPLSTIETSNILSVTNSNNLLVKRNPETDKQKSNISKSILQKFHENEEAYELFTGPCQTSFSNDVSTNMQNCIPAKHTPLNESSVAENSEAYKTPLKNNLPNMKSLSPPVGEKLKEPENINCIKSVLTSCDYQSKGNADATQKCDNKCSILAIEDTYEPSKQRDSMIEKNKESDQSEQSYLKHDLREENQQFDDNHHMVKDTEESKLQQMQEIEEKNVLEDNGSTIKSKCSGRDDELSISAEINDAMSRQGIEHYEQTVSSSRENEIVNAIMQMHKTVNESVKIDGEEIVAGNLDKLHCLPNIQNVDPAKGKTIYKNILESSKALGKNMVSSSVKIRDFPEDIESKMGGNIKEDVVQDTCNVLVWQDNADEVQTLKPLLKDVQEHIENKQETQIGDENKNSCELQCTSKAQTFNKTFEETVVNGIDMKIVGDSSAVVAIQEITVEKNMHERESNSRKESYTVRDNISVMNELSLMVSTKNTNKIADNNNKAEIPPLYRNCVSPFSAGQQVGSIVEEMDTIGNSLVMLPVIRDTNLTVNNSLNKLIAKTNSAHAKEEKANKNTEEHLTAHSHFVFSPLSVKGINCNEEMETMKKSGELMSPAICIGSDVKESLQTSAIQKTGVIEELEDCSIEAESVPVLETDKPSPISMQETVGCSKQLVKENSIKEKEFLVNGKFIILNDLSHAVTTSTAHKINTMVKECSHDSLKCIVGCTNNFLSAVKNNENLEKNIKDASKNLEEMGENEEEVVVKQEAKLIYGNGENFMHSVSANSYNGSGQSVNLTKEVLVLGKETEKEVNSPKENICQSLPSLKTFSPDALKMGIESTNINKSSIPGNIHCLSDLGDQNKMNNVVAEKTTENRNVSDTDADVYVDMPYLEAISTEVSSNDSETEMPCLELIDGVPPKDVGNTDHLEDASTECPRNCDSIEHCMLKTNETEEVKAVAPTEISVNVNMKSLPNPEMNAEILDRPGKLENAELESINEACEESNSICALKDKNALFIDNACAFNNVPEIITEAKILTDSSIQKSAIPVENCNTQNISISRCHADPDEWSEIGFLENYSPESNNDGIAGKKERFDDKEDLCAETETGKVFPVYTDSDSVSLQILGADAEYMQHINSEHENNWEPQTVIDHNNHSIGEQTQNFKPTSQVCSDVLMSHCESELNIQERLELDMPSLVDAIPSQLEPPEIGPNLGDVIPADFVTNWPYLEEEVFCETDNTLYPASTESVISYSTMYHPSSSLEQCLPSNLSETVNTLDSSSDPSNTHSNTSSLGELKCCLSWKKIFDFSKSNRKSRKKHKKNIKKQDDESITSSLNSTNCDTHDTECTKVDDKCITINSGNETSILMSNNKEVDGLELGPAKIEVRIPRSASNKGLPKVWKVVDNSKSLNAPEDPKANRGEGGSNSNDIKQVPIVMVKRLILKRGYDYEDIDKVKKRKNSHKKTIKHIKEKHSNIDSVDDVHGLPQKVNVVQSSHLIHKSSYVSEIHVTEEDEKLTDCEIDKKMIKTSSPRSSFDNSSSCSQNVNENCSSNLFSIAEGDLINEDAGNKGNKNEKGAANDNDSISSNSEHILNSNNSDSMGCVLKQKVTQKIPRVIIKRTIGIDNSNNYRSFLTGAALSNYSKEQWHPIVRLERNASLDSLAKKFMCEEGGTTEIATAQIRQGIKINLKSPPGTPAVTIVPLSPTFPVNTENNNYTHRRKKPHIFAGSKSGSAMEEQNSSITSTVINSSPNNCAHLGSSYVSDRCNSHQGNTENQTSLNIEEEEKMTLNDENNLEEYILVENKHCATKDFTKITFQRHKKKKMQSTRRKKKVSLKLGKPFNAAGEQKFLTLKNAVQNKCHQSRNIANCSVTEDSQNSNSPNELIFSEETEHRNKSCSSSLNTNVKANDHFTSIISSITNLVEDDQINESIDLLLTSSDYTTNDQCHKRSNQKTRKRCVEKEYVTNELPLFHPDRILTCTSSSKKKKLKFEEKSLPLDEQELDKEIKDLCADMALQSSECMSKTTEETNMDVKHIPARENATLELCKDSGSPAAEWKQHDHPEMMCQACGQLYKQFGERTSHIRRHPCHCQQCHLAFKSEDDFMNHLAEQHPRIREKHHCLLCERTFPSAERHRMHLAGRTHRHLELTQRRTIHTLFSLFTGHNCPVLEPLTDSELAGLNWLPVEPGVTHFYHQTTPLQQAVQNLMCRKKGDFANASSITTQRPSAAKQAEENSVASKHLLHEKEM